MRWNAPADAAVEISATLIILALWLWNLRTSERERSRIALTVVLTMVASFLAGLFVRIAVGSYRAVQESGFFGLGLLAATTLLIYGLRARGLFSVQGEGIEGAAPVTGS